MAFSIGGFEFGGVTNTVFGWLRSFVFWGVVLVVILLSVFGSLAIRKKRKLKFPVLEMTDLGGGKQGIRETKAGWFKSKTMFFGLFDYGGDDVMKTKEGTVIQNASSSDFHEIKGKRGMIVARKPDDPRILLPLSRMEITNMSLMSAIAPADFRDASVKIISDTEKETMSKLERIIPYIALGIVAIIFLICIILIIQMVKSSQAEAWDKLLEAGKMAQQSANALASSAP